MNIRFWGVRGSVATSGPHVAKIGGNTSCLEVTSQGERLIFDAGTGVRNLGDELMKAGPLKATMLFSHLHWDHVQGFPFFTPAYLPTTELRLYGPGEGELPKVLAAQMQPPNFPVPLETMRAKLSFFTARPGQPLYLGPFRVTPFETPHPQGCLGYSVEADGRRFVYMTDVELAVETLTPEIRSAVEGADLLVLDGQYTPDEYAGKIGPVKKGWGHSTMVDAAKVACALDVERLFLFHHDPARTDEAVEGMAEEARQHFAATEPAREGKRVQLGSESESTPWPKYWT